MQHEAEEKLRELESQHAEELKKQQLDLQAANV
jgi:hypothetical protein